MSMILSQEHSEWQYFAVKINGYETDTIVSQADSLKEKKKTH